MAVTFLLAREINDMPLDRIADDVFDEPVSGDRLRAFFEDDRHHIAIARDDDLIVGFASAVDYDHPDKPRQLWINEVGVAEPWQRQGIATRLMTMLFEHGRGLGCTEAWVLTEPDNAPANALYGSVAGDADPEPVVAIMHSFKLT